MASRGFQFKQFYVAHDKCAMKVGTDGTLLGAVALVQSAKCKVQSAKCKVLDAGTGSGLVALMLAQRFQEAEIDAIDIDEGAVEQATENFANSPWSERLRAHLARVQDWSINDNDENNGTNGTNNLYDLVVSNPPYFQNSLKNPDKGRELARHTDSLSYEELVMHSRRLLREGGYLCVILPAEAETEMLRLAAINDLQPEKIVYIHPKPEKPAKRVILQLVFNPRKTHERPTIESRNTHKPFQPEKQTIYIESAYSPRSEEYAELTRDFYL